MFAISHSTYSYDLVLYFFSFFSNWIFASYNFTIFYMFLSCCSRFSIYSSLINYFFSSFKVTIKDDFCFIRNDVLIYFFICSSKVFRSKGNLSLSWDYFNLFSSFNFSCFRIIFIDNFCYNLAWYQLFNITITFFFSVVINIFYFNTNFAFVGLFVISCFCTNFDNFFLWSYIFISKFFFCN